MQPDTLTLYGVDGCPAGWLCVSLDDKQDMPTVRISHEVDALFHEVAAAIIAIDIPIGLPSSGVRRCDMEARAILGPRKSSVFPAPMRCTLSARSYEEACAASARACGKRLSKQTYELLPRIRDIDTLLLEEPNLAQRVHEVHPEVSFYHWNSENVMRHSKHSGFGFLERFRLVEEAFPGAAESIRNSVPPKQASDDDILDALAALWTAGRIRAGTARRLGNPPEYDEHGLRMQMLA
jgi:predicted RNase H-like nuclease